MQLDLLKQQHALEIGALQQWQKHEATLQLAAAPFAVPADVAQPAQIKLEKLRGEGKLDTSLANTQPVPLEDLRCPVATCPRHHRPFPRISQFNEVRLCIVLDLSFSIQLFLFPLALSFPFLASSH